MKRAAAQEFVAHNVLGSQEVQEMLMITRTRLKHLVDEGKLKPIKKLTRENLFWFDDVDQLKKQYLKDTKSNVYKNKHLEDLKDAK
jgi:hypothetical protein